MKKIDVKSLVLGLAIGVVSVAGVSAVADNPDIKSVYTSPSKVYYYEQEIPLNDPLITVVREGHINEKTYMPVRELLEYMNFTVEWQEEDASIHLTMNNNMKNTYSQDSQLDSNANVDSEVIRIITNTGNWGYVEPYLKDVSDDTIRQVVDIYNSKHSNKKEHKNADDYISN